MVFERLTPPCPGENIKSMRDPLQRGLYNVCAAYQTQMPYSKGIQLDKKHVYFAFTSLVFLFRTSLLHL